METATQKHERDMLQDRRKHEARAIGHAIFDEIRDLLPPEIESEVHARLLDVIYRNGVLLVRDSERGKLGLGPLDDKGWTPSDRVKFYQDRIAAMTQMPSYIIKPPAPKADT